MVIRLENVDGMIGDVYTRVLERDGRVLRRTMDGYVILYSCGHERKIDQAAIADTRNESEFRREMQRYMKCDRPECAERELTPMEAYWHACSGTPIN